MSSPRRMARAPAAAQAVQPADAGGPGKPRGPLAADADRVARSLPAGAQSAACQSDLGHPPLDFGSPTPVGYTPAQIRTAYGINNVTFGTVTGDGAGQTIAIVDAYDDPAFVNSTDPSFSTSDLAMFDQQFNLPNPPSFTKYNENGQTTNLPGTDPAGAGNLNGNWEMEEALDIEWAHAIAPAASIDLVEASNDTNNTDMFTAGEDGRQPARRLGRLDELGDRRVQRRAGRRLHVHHPRPATRASPSSRPRATRDRRATIRPTLRTSWRPAASR